MVSLNAPLRGGDGQLLDLIGRRDDPAAPVDCADELAPRLARLGPLDRAILAVCHSGTLSEAEAAARLGVSALAVRRRLRAAERRARGRKRRKGVPAPGAGVECPVGTVRVRQWHRRPARFIKVAMAPPLWKPYARWLWEQRNGPTPAGRRVLHKNGDTLDDSPGNLVLGKPADAAFLFQSRSEANFKRTMAACREGCRRANRERAVARDLLGVLRLSEWYAIDHDRRTIVGSFGRTCRPAYEAIGVPRPPGADRSPMPWLAAQLGWPGLPASEALVLAVLAQHVGRPRRQAEIAGELRPLAARLGRPVAATDSYMIQALCGARRRRLIASIRRGRHEITPAPLGSREPVCLLAVVRGRECRTWQEEGYAVVPATAGV